MRTKQPRRLEREELFEYAVKALATRACSTSEIKSKMRLRAADPADIDPLVARLKDVGYLDDRRFAENFATNRVDHDGFGRTRVLLDLRSRKVAGDLAAKAVDKALDGKSEADLIDAYIERRIPLIAAGGRIEDDKKLASAYRKLRRAGFNTGPILAALKRFAARPESIEEFPEEEPSDD